MGARGPTPKPDRLRQNKPKKPELALAGELEAPEPPEGLLSATRAWWFSFWGSKLAKAVQTETDLRALERLAKRYDAAERTELALAARPGGPVAGGSQGQDVLHPLAKYQAQLDNEIRALEDRFGLNPRARLALGLQLTQARRELEDLWGDLDREDQTPLTVVELGEAGSDVSASKRKVHRTRAGGR